MYLSIIVPSHNASETIGNLLKSLAISKTSLPFEIIVVDDGSTDQTLDVAKRFWQTQKKKLSRGLAQLRLVRLKHNVGPAAARNRGAARAKGKILLFLDSDVEVFPKTIARVVKVFQQDSDLHALTGVWDKHQKTRDFFPRFKALRDWSYWINERDQRGYYYLFSTRVAAIRKDLFFRLGGFNERYKGPSVEDIEFTYKISRRYAVIFDPQVRVRHEFESFRPIVRKYFIRSRDWIALYRQRGRFDPVATTQSEATTTLAAFGLVVSALAFLLLDFPVVRTFVSGFFQVISLPYVTIYGLPWYQWIVFGLLVFFFCLHAWGVRKFMHLVYKEAGLGFMIKSFFMGVFLYLVIILGAVSYFWDQAKKSD